MKSATSRPRFSALSLRGKFLPVRAVLAVPVIGVVALCTMSARRDHAGPVRMEDQARALVAAATTFRLESHPPVATRAPSRRAA